MVPAIPQVQCVRDAVNDKRYIGFVFYPHTGDRKYREAIGIRNDRFIYGCYERFLNGCLDNVVRYRIFALIEQSNIYIGYIVGATDN